MKTPKPYYGSGNLREKRGQVYNWLCERSLIARLNGHGVIDT